VFVLYRTEGEVTVHCLWVLSAHACRTQTAAPLPLPAQRHAAPCGPCRAGGSRSTPCSAAQPRMTRRIDPAAGPAAAAPAQPGGGPAASAAAASASASGGSLPGERAGSGGGPRAAGKVDGARGAGPLRRAQGLLRSRPRGPCRRGWAHRVQPHARPSRCDRQASTPSPARPRRPWGSPLTRDHGLKGAHGRASERVPVGGPGVQVAERVESLACVCVWGGGG
jgi:hypothetical protein